jgi:hypothetical protein
VAENKKMPTDDYEVGKGKPPKAHQWAKGQSGNPRGRPKSKNSGSTDVAAILEAPVKVKVGGKECDMSTFEAGFRQLAKTAVGGNLPAILKFGRLCEEYGVIAPPLAPKVGGVFVMPKDVDYSEQRESVSELVADDEA